MSPYYEILPCPFLDDHDASTCWVFYGTNDRFSANLICFSECLSCSFVLKDSQGGNITRHFGYVKAYKMRNYIILETLLKVNSFSLSHPQMRISDGSLFHCCFLLIVYMIHLVNGGATLEIGYMDLHIEERSHLLDAPSVFHPCLDIELWYTNKSIFVDCAHMSCSMDISYT